MVFGELNCCLTNRNVVWPKDSFQCKDCRIPDLQIIPSPANSMILYTLGNILGFFHKTKCINTYEKYVHKFDTNLSPYVSLSLSLSLSQ